MRCAVLGHPVVHSLSPALHRAAYVELGLDGWTYEPIEVDSAGLAELLDGLDPARWRGLSLTMPLKRTVVPLLDTVDDWVRLSGVANTVVLDADRRTGANTDVPGALAALKERGITAVERVLVLGGGATAASMVLALADQGCTSARLLVRDPARAEETVTVVARHPAEVVLEVGLLSDPGTVESDLVVSTVPVEAQDAGLVEAVAGVPCVFDVVYDPWPTPLATAAERGGRRLVSGLDLLAHQAVLQVELMTGRSVDVEVLRSAGLAELRRRADLATPPVHNPDAGA